jgi:hypothetical protein
MNRKLFVLFCALGLTLSAAMPALPQAVNRAAVEKQVLANERALNEAYAKADIKPFNEFLAPDAMALEATGPIKVPNPDFEKMMKDSKIQSWNIDQSKFFWVNDNTVIHTYRWTGKATYQGQPAPNTTWSSTVWTNKGGKWQAVFHQETVAMTPPAAPAAPSGGKK